MVGIEINVLKTTGAGIFPGIVDSCAAISITVMVRIHIHGTYPWIQINAADKIIGDQPAQPMISSSFNNRYHCGSDCGNFSEWVILIS
jgi:hypothetical protein